MGEVVSFELPDGGTVLVELADESVYGLEEISANGGTVVRRAREGLAEALDGIRRMAAEAHARITSIDAAPKRLELEFGVKFSGETGAVLAKASGEAHFVVRAVWEQ